ncbi:MAG: hypothetical protein AB7E96_06980 [Deferribacterales bacterium]
MIHDYSAIELAEVARMAEKFHFLNPDFVSSIDVESDEVLARRDIIFFDSREYVSFSKAKQILVDYFPDLAKGCKNKVRQFSVLLANLKEADSRKVHLVIGFRPDDYSKTGEYADLGYKCFVAMRNELEKSGMIEVIKGRYNKKSGKGYRSKIKVLEPLSNILKTIEHGEIKKKLVVDEDLVMLKDRKEEKSKTKVRVEISTEGIHKDYKGYISDSKQSLRLYNDFIVKNSFCCPVGKSGLLAAVDASRFQLYRVYSNGSFEQGGRLYGAYHQLISEKQRSQMTINGKAACELDFKACMIRMMYHKKGIDYPEGKDPYTDILEVAKISEWKLATNKELYRELLKPIIITITNCVSESSFRKALRIVLKYVKKAEYEAGELVYNLSDNFEERITAGILTVHSAISDYFYKKSALYFQRYDSDIALDVISQLAKKGVPVLPIHDSFVTTVDNKELLRSTMIQAYYNALGFNPVIH